MKKLFFLLLIGASVEAQQLAPLTVEKIMRDPKWIGVAPSNVFSIALKTREFVFLILRNAFAGDFNNLIVLIINPDFSFKVDFLIGRLEGSFSVYSPIFKAFIALY